MTAFGHVYKLSAAFLDFLSITAFYIPVRENLPNPLRLYIDNTMPALSSSPPRPVILSSPVYLFLAVVLLLAIGTILSRIRRQSNSPQPSPLQEPTMEKAPLLSPIQGPSSTNPPLRLPGTHSHLPSAGPSLPLSQPISPEVVVLDAPRRRSYTKMTPAGTEISGEIIIAEGWRRHTKVFGGGVCAACEENERRLKTIGAPSSATAGLA